MAEEAGGVSLPAVDAFGGLKESFCAFLRPRCTSQCGAILLGCLVASRVGLSGLLELPLVRIVLGELKSPRRSTSWSLSFAWWCIDSTSS